MKTGVDLKLHRLPSSRYINPQTGWTITRILGQGEITKQSSFFFKFMCTQLWICVAVGTPLSTHGSWQICTQPFIYYISLLGNMVKQNFPHNSRRAIMKNLRYTFDTFYLYQAMASILWYIIPNLIKTADHCTTRIDCILLYLFGSIILIMSGFLAIELLLVHY